MAVMTTQERSNAHTEWMRTNAMTQSATCTKALALQTISAIDQWVSDNQAALIATLPTAARPANGGYTSAQLAQMFVLVLRRRFDLGV